MSKLVDEWVGKAEEDYEVLENLYERKERFATSICFHAQQCAEKYLKALLTKHKLEPPWIHSLETLLDMLVSRLPELEEAREMLSKLTPYGVEYRYPGTKATPTDAEKCVEMIRKLRTVFRNLLGLEH